MKGTFFLPFEIKFSENLSWHLRLALSFKQSDMAEVMQSIEAPLVPRLQPFHETKRVENRECRSATTESAGVALKTL